MAQPETPASASRNSIVSPLAGGMTTAQLEQVLQRTPQMTRFNPLRRHLRAPETPNPRISKSEIIASDDEAATTSPPAPIVQPPESLTGEAIRDKGKEGSVATGGDNADQGTSKSIDTLQVFENNREAQKVSEGATYRIQTRYFTPCRRAIEHIVPGKKDDEKAALSRNGSGSPVESNTLLENPDPLNDETSDGSQESTSLEELIRTTSRTHNSQPSSDPEVRDISFSFGAPRLVRNAIMGSHKRDTNSNNLDDLEIDILGLSHATHSSDCTPDPSGSEDAPIDHTSRKGGRPSPKKQQKKRVNKRSRRVPVDELHLVSERVAEFSQETDDENVEPSTEILDDPISQDSSDALKIIQSVGRTKGEKKVFQTYHGAFGKIDNKAFRFPDSYNTSPRAESSNRHEVSSSHSDGFVGAEANPTGRCMLLPKQKRACVSIWGLTVQVAQLELVREKVHELVGELNAQAERRVPAEKTKRRLKKKATLSASVMIELESQANKTGESPQDDQDSQSHEDRDANQDDQPMHGYLSGDELISVAEVKSPLPPTRKGPRRVTFDEKVEIDRRVRIPSSDCENLDDSFEVRRRKKSSDSAVWLNMETVCLKRCHDEDSEEDSEDDVLSINESERSVISIASDNVNDEMEESDGSGYDSDEEMGDEEEEDEAEDQNENEHENEEESGECFDVLGVHGKQSDESIDGIILSTEDESREENQQGNGKDDDRDDFYASEKDAIPNKPVGGEEEITGVFVSEGLNSQASQLSIAMSLQTTTQALKLPEAGGWRIRKPKSSDVMNETQEDIFDSSSPISTIVKRKSTGLHTRRRTTFRSRPLALTIDRPSTPPSPEIPETQIAAPQIPEARLIAVRDISPELGESQPSNTPDEFDRFILDAPPPTSHGQSLHSSQLSFIPDEIPDETYFCRASQVLEEHKTPMSRSKSTQVASISITSRALRIPLMPSQTPRLRRAGHLLRACRPSSHNKSYRPTPRSEKSLSRLTRQASSAWGTLPGSARKRTKTLPFKPPFKKPNLEDLATPNSLS
ncbi:uncharacterized protein EAF02_008874 [Botrytis sinoallii]|uniref:uncharacterized protein n=1 Tax=Botrytis sinoallii TaxID=1463999 RepID=UPI0018FF7F19|nr:uncharacterized protein EAF02_008874 [Botrytis sinoallii]KAF7872803.1 hypothetical protein EAF02_008874 [Botrytis sinoallii]